MDRKLDGSDFEVQGIKNAMAGRWELPTIFKSATVTGCDWADFQGKVQAVLKVQGSFFGGWHCAILIEIADIN